MITKDNLTEVLLYLGFKKDGDIYEKQFHSPESVLKVDFKKQELVYPEGEGLIVNERQTCNFKDNENFVVFECVFRLLNKGYTPEHIELEPKWKVGHGASGGRADILVKDNYGDSLLIIECKTSGKEHSNAWRDTMHNGGQLFSYVQQARSTQFTCLYSSDFEDGKLIPAYQLITFIDNEKLLEEQEISPENSYKGAKRVEDLHRVWSETYRKDYSTKGLFESDIPPYHIGKHKFSLKDLQTINSKDIQGKYHEFATILRQHNVSGRENAFDKLVNLFLCKIVDESQNPEELKFYWKGIAYDSFFELQDRLQLLYQAGMKEFLGEEVTYIDNTSIDDAFRFFKKDPDSTKDTIKKYFRELKFFTNNDFAFIDVHNEKLFYQNAVVLLKIIQMLQDIRLKTDDQNQFLGDMFEGFLDQGIKQSEGQFFTPMPIVKFILSSLPLETVIKESEKPPLAIDYACGAGHFLNEYALQIKPLVKRYKKLPLSSYYESIVGIEKEYRLSKVAKVSAFMYGQDDIQIVYNDALAENKKIKNGTFSVLVANPPYSVKGFLETLNKADRACFELTDCIEEKSFSSNNSIEAFFIERAKQLLKSGGVAAIVMPSSILSKGNNRASAKKTNVYVYAREILLKYFDIVAISEFGTGTFGKTGTNTITLFLRRRKSDPAPHEHYRNRVESWFKGDKSKDNVFEDEQFVKDYCAHMDYSFSDYIELLSGKVNSNLANEDLFKEYRKDFENLAEVKNRKKLKAFKSLSKSEQLSELENKFVIYVQAIEKDKLYFFIMANLTPSETLIIRSPSGKSEMKKFLGYEWSSAKGNEGIKYLGNKSVSLEKDEEGEENIEQDDKRVLENLLNLNSIQTPLYDPNSLNSSDKINSLVRANFNGEKLNIQDELKGFVTSSRLVDMLDFSRKEFNKAINLKPKQSLSIASKWEQVKISSIISLEYGKNLPEAKRIKGDFPVVGSNGVVGFHKEKLVDGPCIVVGRKGSAGKVNWISDSCTPIDTTFYVKEQTKTTNYRYLYLLLSMIGLEKLAGGTGVPGLNRDDVYSQKLPIPPLDIQKKIVEECDVIDQSTQKSTEKVQREKDNIKREIAKIYSEGWPKRKLSSLIEIIGGGTPSTSVSDYWDGDIPWLSVADFNNDNRYVTTAEKFITKQGLDNSSAKYLQTNDLIISARGTVGALAQLSVPMTFNQSCYGLRGSSDVDNGFLYFILKNEISQFKDNAYGSKFDSITTRTFDSIQIPLPTLDRQVAMLESIEKIEPIIYKETLLIESSDERKQNILTKYL